jgi:hypothetical protein
MISKKPKKFTKDIIVTNDDVIHSNEEISKSISYAYI